MRFAMNNACFLEKKTTRSCSLFCQISKIHDVRINKKKIIQFETRVKNRNGGTGVIIFVLNLTR